MTILNFLEAASLQAEYLEQRLFCNSATRPVTLFVTPEIGDPIFSFIGFGSENLIPFSAMNVNKSNGSQNSNYCLNRKEEDADFFEQRIVSFQHPTSQLVINVFSRRDFETREEVTPMDVLCGKTKEAFNHCKFHETNPATQRDSTTTKKS